MSEAPKWLLNQFGITQRQWKERKRRELRDVLKAMSVYHMGCAYTPNGEGEVGRITKDLESLAEKLSVRNWGR